MVDFFDFEKFRYLGLVSVIIYFIFDHWDGRRISDEREELIRLKSSGLAHRMMMATLTLMALLFLIFPTMHAFYPIMATIISAMYGEIFGKLFYRWKL